MVEEEQVSIWRQDECKSLEEKQQVRLVKLRRQNEQSGKLGFSLRGGKQESTGSSVGVFVSHVERSSEADKKGLKIGDQLLQVNGLCVDQATYDQVIGLIKRTPKAQEIQLKVTNLGRIPFQEKSGDPIKWLQVVDCGQTAADNYLSSLKAGRSSDSMESIDSEQAPVSPSHFQETSSGVPGAEFGLHEKLCSSHTGDDSALSSALTLSNDDSSSSVTSGCSVSSISSHSMLSESSLSSVDRDLRETRVSVPGGRSCNEPFGCGVVKGPEEWPGIFVQNIKPASLAERVGLEPGDQLVRADGQLLDEIPFEAAIQLIKQLQARQDVLVLHVKKGAALRHLASGRQQKEQQQWKSCGQQHLSASLAEKQTNGDETKQASGLGGAITGAFREESTQKSPNRSDEDLLNGKRLIDIGQRDGDTQTEKQQVDLGDRSRTEKPMERGGRLQECRRNSASPNVESAAAMPTARSSIRSSSDQDSWCRPKVETATNKQEDEQQNEQQKEEIRIVKSQNCKLCSRIGKFPLNKANKSKSKSRPAPPIPKQRNQQQQPFEVRLHHVVSRHKPVDQDVTRQACPPTNTHRTNQMQRYLSVDNLRSVELASVDASSSATSSSSASPRQLSASYARQVPATRKPRSSSVSRRRQGCLEFVAQTGNNSQQQVSAVIAQPPVLYRRSNSVLGYSSADICHGYQSDQPTVYLSSSHKSANQQPVLARLAGNSYSQGSCGCQPVTVSYVNRKRYACNTLAVPMAPLHSKAKSMDKLNVALGLTYNQQPNCQRHRLLSSISTAKPARIYQQRRPVSIIQTSMSFERRPQQMQCRNLLPVPQQRARQQQQQPIYHYAATSGIISNTDNRLMASACCAEAQQYRVAQPAMLVSHQMVTQQTAIATCLPGNEPMHRCVCCLPNERLGTLPPCCQPASLSGETEPSSKCLVKRSRRQVQVSKSVADSTILHLDGTTTDSSGYLSCNGEQYRRASHHLLVSPAVNKSQARLPRPPPPPPPSMMNSSSLSVCKRDTRQQRLSTFSTTRQSNESSLSPIKDYSSTFGAPGERSSTDSSLEALPSRVASSATSLVQSKAPPRPPPPPDRDLEFERKVGKVLHKKQQGGPPAADVGSLKQLDESSLASEQLSDDKPNRLCFVDELKMLAKRQQVNGNGSNNNNMESATLIKIINASKSAGAANPRKGCSCSAASSQRQDCPAASCCKRQQPQKQTSGQPPASKAAGKLGDEESKRRQHELLMKEFKSAHSRMFNKRRQQQTNPAELQANAKDNNNNQQVCRPADRKVVIGAAATTCPMSR